MSDRLALTCLAASDELVEESERVVRGGGRRDGRVRPDYRNVRYKIKKGEMGEGEQRVGSRAIEIERERENKMK